MPSLSHQERISVIDIFAGPGGLGEGFARFPYTKPAEPRYKVCLSIEKDERARETLRLRSFTRQFNGAIPSDYYRLLKRTELDRDERISQILARHPDEAESADNDAMCVELGNSKHQSCIETALREKVGDVRDWVLLGGRLAKPTHL